MAYRKLYIVLLLIVVMSRAAVAQDPHFSQFFANPLYLNPAFAGTVVCPRVSINYRNQWLNLPGYFNTYSASYDLHRDALSGGIGFMAVADRQAGIISNYSFSMMYSYNMSTGPNFNIKAGFEARIFQKKLDWEKLYFGDQIDPMYGFIYETFEQEPEKKIKIGPDFSFGLLFYNKSFFAGMAAHHLTQPDEGFITKTHLPRKYTVHAGAVFDVSAQLVRGNRMRRSQDDPTISPNIIYQHQRYLEQLNYGLYYNSYPLILGMWYRHNFINSDAVTVLLGVQANIFKFGYSYDLTISRLQPSTGGAHELSCGMKLPCRPEKKRIRVINCPTF